jgi:hypothetical protein
VEKPKLVIVGDPETGNVSVTGKLDNAHLMHWLLGEANRIVMRHLNEQDATPKSDIFVAQQMPRTL